MTKDVLLCIQGLQFEEEAQNDEELDKIETDRVPVNIITETMLTTFFMKNW